MFVLVCMNNQAPIYMYIGFLGFFFILQKFKQVNNFMILRWLQPLTSGLIVADSFLTDI